MINRLPALASNTIGLEARTTANPQEVNPMPESPRRHAASLVGTIGLVFLLLVGAFAPLRASADHPKFGKSRIDRSATYEALIRRSAGGIPHIRAHDFASLGFGTGYAMAEDIGCTLADQFLTFGAERAAALGDPSNVASDFLFQLLIDRGEALEPVDPRQAALFRGAAAGYNRFLRETGVDDLPDPTCRGASWVREASEIDFRRISRTNFFLPFVIPLIVAASPPTPVADAASAAGRPEALTTEERENIALVMAELSRPRDEKGSNAIGLGRDATARRTGMLLANPHQPWFGTSRFYAFHQTLPGELNVLGANVIGRPQVGFGTTRHVAWTSTVSTASRFSFYQLRLVPGNPTQYLFDGEPRDMIQETVIVQVPDGAGGLVEQSHTFYSTHFGAFLVGGQLPWNEFVAFAVRPADAGWRGIDSLVDQYQARSVRELKAIHDAGQFLPVNLIAADSSGEALFADPGPVPNLSDAQRADCDAGFGNLDGSRSECMWGDDPSAAAPGLLPPSQQPELFRSDYVENSNDSFWLANPAAPITGLPSIVGSTGAEQTLRTRSGNRMIAERLAGEDGLRGRRFRLHQLQKIMLSNQNYAGQVLRDGVVALCEASPNVTLEDGSVVDISGACPVLATWNLRDDLESRGAHVFRELMVEAGSRGARRMPGDFNFLTPFDEDDPLATPRDLDPNDNPAVLAALARAVQKLADAGIPLDAKLGDIQGVTRAGEFIPLHGGPESSGVFNKIGSDFAGAAGYPEVTASSSSWIQATEFTRWGPRSRGILTYSLSTNPESPHFADQTKRFSKKRWLRLPFEEWDVEWSARSRDYVVEGRRDCRRDGWRAFSNPAFSDRRECVAYFKELRRERLREIDSRY